MKMLILITAFTSSSISISSYDQQAVGMSDSEDVI